MIRLKDLLEGVVMDNDIWEKLVGKDLEVIRPFEITPQTATKPNVKLQPGQIVKVIMDPKQAIKVAVEFEGEKYTADTSSFLYQIKIKK